MRLVITLDTTGLDAGDDKIIGITLLNADTGETVLDSDNWAQDKTKAKELITTAEEIILFNYDFIEEFLTEDEIEFDNNTDVMEDISDEIDPENGRHQSLKKCAEYYKYKKSINTRQEKAEAILYCYNAYYDKQRKIYKKTKNKKSKGKKIFIILILIVIASVVYQIIKG